MRTIYKNTKYFVDTKKNDEYEERQMLRASKIKTSIQIKDAKVR